MVVRKRLPWQRQVCWTQDTHAKMFQLNFRKSHKISGTSVNGFETTQLQS